MDSTYIKFELHATLGNVQLATFSITPEHRDRTLALWHAFHAKNITVQERMAPDLPYWHVTIRAIRKSNLVWETLHIQASSRENLMRQLEKREYQHWQISTAKIDLIQEESCS